MIANRYAPARNEAAVDVRGPTVRGSLATSHRAYPTALFGETIETTGIATSVATVIDMAVFADGNTHASWLGGGVYVKIRAGSAPVRIAQAFDSGTSVAVSSTNGRPLAANEECELIVDEDSRYLQVISTSGTATLTHWKNQLPNSAISLSDA